MKKKLIIIIPSIVVILMTITILGSIGANAWFSDQEKSEENRISAGSLDPELRGAEFSITDAKPDIWYGPSDPITFFNHTDNSSIAVKYRISSEMVSQSVEGFYDKINVDLERREGNSWTSYYNGPLKDLYVDPSICSYMSSLASGSSHEWRLSIQVDATAGNEFQIAGAVFKLVFDSTQDNNPGWVE